MFCDKNVPVQTSVYCSSTKGKPAGFQTTKNVRGFSFDPGYVLKTKHLLPQPKTLKSC